MDILVLAALLILTFMTAVFLLAMALRDNSIVDIFYGTAFLVACWGAYAVHGVGHGRQVLMLALLTIWGCRLAIHLFVRKQGQGEDFRYRRWREEWGRTFVWRSFLQIFMLQGLVVLVVASPVLLVIRDPGGPLGLVDGAGFSVWFFGFFFEAVGDWQLVKFKKNPASRGHIMRFGLWRFTRHPNYFGEATLWWGVFLIGFGSPNGILGLISPLLIGFLLLKVSGIPMLEEKYAGNPEFEAYRRQTNALVPWVPRSEEGATQR